MTPDQIELLTTFSASVNASQELDRLALRPHTVAELDAARQKAAEAKRAMDAVADRLAGSSDELRMSE